MTEYSSNQGSGTTARQTGHNTGTADRAKEAVGEVAGTAKQQATVVASEAKTQAGQAIGHLRNRAAKEADTQAQKAAQGIRQWADDLANMADNGKPDSPVRTVTHQVADTSRRAADYLEEHGIAGVAEDVQQFARRRPGLFLAGAVAAGFLVGRLAKTGVNAGKEDQETTERRGWQGTGQGYDRGYTSPAGETGYTSEPYATQVREEYIVQQPGQGTVTQPGHARPYTGSALGGIQDPPSTMPGTTETRWPDAGEERR
ncbi:hypothetical protein GCM10022226_65030 [Sphaerisporangium flaviroseum]|uniref:DUF3618 domain-containing protein n=1 Tax=Sphaerisporangium flaviroseum TaxID=509199 RepID=A0ABP7J5W1_9ACTN